MRTIVRAVLPVWFIVSFAVPCHGEELPLATAKDGGLSGTQRERIKAVVQAQVDKKQTAGAVIAVARRGKVVLLETFGNMEIEAAKPMRPDAIFRIYSMSKPITTVAAMRLWEEGRFQLDDPVAKYLPELKGLRVHAGKGHDTVAAQRPLTIRDLMRHTSGFTYGFFGDTPVDRLYRENKIEDANDNLADLVRKLGTLPLAWQPGTRFNYSVSTDVLGRIIEVISGKTLDEFFQERVFAPLDMKDTAFFVPADKLERLAATYGPGDKGTLKLLDAPAASRFRSRPKFLSGGGGLVSTARDYLRFCQMMLNQGEIQGTRLLRAETVRQMTTNQLPDEALPMKLAGFPLPGMGFGLGFSVRLAKSPAERAAPSAGEYGWSGAASTSFWVSPKPELVAIILQQVMPFTFRLEMALKPVIYGAIAD